MFYRLNVVQVQLPPLRQRAEDIPKLVKYFLQKYGAELGVESPAIQPEAIAFLCEQPWPGNIRQLENVVRQTLLLARKYTITLDHARQVLARMNRPAERPDATIAAWVSDFLLKARLGQTDRVHGKVIDALERELFAQAIHLAHGNQAKAARWLGVSRITMREKLTAFGLRPENDPA